MLRISIFFAGISLRLIDIPIPLCSEEQLVDLYERALAKYPKIKIAILGKLRFVLVCCYLSLHSKPWLRRIETTSYPESLSRVAESEMECPTPNPNFPEFPTPTPSHKVNKVWLSTIL